jgi:adenylate cyclase
MNGGGDLSADRQPAAAESRRDCERWGAEHADQESGLRQIRGRPGRITSNSDFPFQPPGPKTVFSQSIRRKIVGIALGLVVLMIGTSILSMLMAKRVGHLVDELTNKYVPAYEDLARTNVRSLERALALRQMVIAKMQAPPDDVAFAQPTQIYRTKDGEITEEAEAARNLIVSIIEDTSTPSDNVALALIDGRIEAAATDVRRL